MLKILTEKEGFIYEKILAMLLAAFMSFSLVACGQEQDKKENIETENTDKENSEMSQETVEVTLDNWQDYFELRLVVKEDKNDFDELETIYPTTYFIIKEEFENSVVEMDIAVEYSLKNPYYQEFSYNIETGEMIDGDVIEGSLMEYEQTDTFTLSFNTDFSWGDIYMDYGHKIVEGIDGGSFALDGNIASVKRRMYTNVDITRVEGSLTLVK